jgi:hypothetical protein
LDLWRESGCEFSKPEETVSASTFPDLELQPRAIPALVWQVDIECEVPKAEVINSASPFPDLNNPYLLLEWDDRLNFSSV